MAGGLAAWDAAKLPVVLEACLWPAEWLS